jgi:hypothetical protein
VLRAGRPRGVTFEIPNRAVSPAHETGLERDAVPGLGASRLITPTARNTSRIAPGPGHSVFTNGRLMKCQSRHLSSNT